MAGEALRETREGKFCTGGALGATGLKVGHPGEPLFSCTELLLKPEYNELKNQIKIFSFSLPNIFMHFKYKISGFHVCYSELYGKSGEIVQAESVV